MKKDLSCLSLLLIFFGICLFSVFAFIFLLTDDQVQRSKVIQEEHLKYLQQQPSRVIADLNPQEIQRALENDWGIVFEAPSYSKVDKVINHRGSITRPNGQRISCTITTTFEEQTKFLSFDFTVDFKARSPQVNSSSDLDKTTLEFIQYFSKFFAKDSTSQLLVSWAKGNSHNPSVSKIVIDQILFLKTGTLRGDGTPNHYRTFSVKKETSH